MEKLLARLTSDGCQQLGSNDKGVLCVNFSAPGGYGQPPQQAPPPAQQQNYGPPPAQQPPYGQPAYGQQGSIGKRVELPMILCIHFCTVV